MNDLNYFNELRGDDYVQGEVAINTRFDSTEFDERMRMERQKGFKTHPVKASMDRDIVEVQKMKLF